MTVAPLRLRRLDPRAPAAAATPRLRIVWLQVAFALGLVVAGAFVFVGAIERLAGGVGVSGAMLALIIAPIATELPEKLNSVLWIRQGKDTLAMGNITGAMVFQSMIPTVVALVFAPAAWSVSAGAPIVFASAGIAFISTAAIFVPMRIPGRPARQMAPRGGRVLRRLPLPRVRGGRHGRGRARLRPGPARGPGRGRRVYSAQSPGGATARGESRGASAW